jgi:hypothetical protein
LCFCCSIIQTQLFVAARVHAWCICHSSTTSTRRKARVRCSNFAERKIRRRLSLLKTCPTKRYACCHDGTKNDPREVFNAAHHFSCVLFSNAFDRAHRMTMCMSHTIPQLQSIFSRMMQLVGKTGGFLLRGRERKTIHGEMRITLSKPLARSHDITVHVVYQLMIRKRKEGRRCAWFCRRKALGPRAS